MSEAPETKADGDLWHDTANHHLYIWRAASAKWDDLGEICGEAAKAALYAAGTKWVAEGRTMAMH